MASLKPYSIIDFGEGITGNLRGNYGVGQIAHFNIYEDRLEQFVDLKEDSVTESSVNQAVGGFANTLSGNDQIFYALRPNDSSNTLVVKTANDPSGDGWSVEYNIGSAADDSFLFIYKNNLMFMAGPGDLKAFDLATTTFFGSGGNVGTGLGRNTLNGINEQVKPVHHPLDDYAYFAGSNRVSRLTDAPGTGTFTSAALTLPDNQEISCMTDYGSFLLIGQTPTEPEDTPIIYFWDRNTASNFLIDKQRLGPGQLKFLGTPGGVPTAIVARNRVNTGTTRTELHVYRYDGSQFKLVKESLIPDFTFASGNHFFEDKDKLYFAGSNNTFGGGSAEDDKRVGIYAVDGRGAITCEQLVYDATDITSANDIGAIYRASDYWYLAGGNDTVYKTDTASSARESVLATRMLDHGNPFVSKKLKGFMAIHGPLATGQTVTLEYLRPTDSTWTTLISKSYSSETANHEKTTAITTNGAAGMPNGIYNQVRAVVSGGVTLYGLFAVPSEYNDDSISL